ncbi:hypothetical protein M422DRAFT_41478 [Sphaerobolus stellatus SS14]|nr:hypothetical protein M422DRAFT_41478 [Sphaerobolus stellatus SS14]
MTPLTTPMTGTTNSSSSQSEPVQSNTSTTTTISSIHRSSGSTTIQGTVTGSSQVTSGSPSRNQQKAGHLLTGPLAGGLGGGLCLLLGFFACLLWRSLDYEVNGSEASALQPAWRQSLQGYDDPSDIIHGQASALDDADAERFRSSKIESLTKSLDHEFVAYGIAYNDASSHRSENGYINRIRGLEFQSNMESNKGNFGTLGSPDSPDIENILLEFAKTRRRKGILQSGSTSFADTVSDGIAL